MVFTAKPPTESIGADRIPRENKKCERENKGTKKEQVSRNDEVYNRAKRKTGKEKQEGKRGTLFFIREKECAVSAARIFLKVTKNFSKQSLL